MALSTLFTTNLYSQTKQKLACPVDILLSYKPEGSQSSLEVRSTKTHFPYDSPYSIKQPDLQYSTPLTTRYQILNVNTGLGLNQPIQLLERKSDKQLLLAQPTSTQDNEIYVGSLALHPNLLTVIDVVHDNGKMIPITEFCKRDLLSQVQYNHKINIQDTMYQLVDGLHFLHTRGIAHRDLKLENIFVASDDSVKITGFGCSLISSDRDGNCKSDEMVGSLPYMAPEMVSGTTYDAYQADTWSLGIIFLTLCTGHFPWSLAHASPPQPDARYHRYTRHPRTALQLLHLAPSALRLALLMLNPDPQHRITCHQLIQELDSISTLD